MSKDSFGDLRPDLISEWNYEKNGNLSPFDYTLCSNVIVWWKCDKGCGNHEWETGIQNRAKLNARCLCCINKIACPCGCNSLETLSPSIAKEWNYEKNGELTPFTVPNGSRKLVWWKCDKCPSHIWETRICNRTKRGARCLFCMNKLVCPCGCNSLAKVRPDIAKEWDYEKNGDKSPLDYVFGNNTGNIWWLCKNGHSWNRTIYRRTHENVNCPQCIYTCSKGERLVSEILDEKGIKYITQKRIMINYKEHLGKRYKRYKKRYNITKKDVVLYIDFFIEKYNVAIEFDGEFHFTKGGYVNAEEKYNRQRLHDKLKTEYCCLNNITLLRIHHKDTEDVNGLIDDINKPLSRNLIIYTKSYPDSHT